MSAATFYAWVSLLALVPAASAAIYGAHLSFSKLGWKDKDARYRWLRPALWVRTTAIAVSIWLLLWVFQWILTLSGNADMKSSPSAFIILTQLQAIIVPCAASIAMYFCLATQLVLAYWFKTEAKRNNPEIDSLFRVASPVVLTLTIPLTMYRFFTVQYYFWYTDYHTMLFEAFKINMSIQPMIELVFTVVSIISLVRLYKVRDTPLQWIYKWLLRIHILSLFRQVFQFWALAAYDSNSTFKAILMVATMVTAGWGSAVSLLIAVNVLYKSSEVPPEDDENIVPLMNQFEA